MKGKKCETSRDAVGIRSGLAGLLGNLLLFLIKGVAGVLSNSVAVTADAMNNLADCVSSLVTLLGFSFSGRGKDSAHPYGHGRMEYICGFSISLLIMITGASVGADALGRLLHPLQITITGLTVAALSFSIAIKALMAWYVGYLNKNVRSTALKAVQRDNFSDALVTAATLMGILAVPHTDLPVDGMLGIAVTVVILKSGFSSFCESLVLLLGEGVDADTEDGIMQIISQFIPAKSVEEISLHDYGPENKLVYIKLDPPPADKMSSSSRTLARIKQQLKQELQIDATLYWDLSEEPK
ncbi:cation diffusion facilitator family transporter [Bacilliculturomica massiliensis]|uniref:cation diffusion facilitator family transporter n=1 Tax=Bacilliculturomica massiliensis TaxID=1917867 RepID=UPI0010314CB1|nr:cation diffusion facilitator family transporter [Bacilliculturomica massiliensis]